MTCEHSQRGSLARCGLSRTLLQPVGCYGKAPRRIAFNQGLEHDDLELARVVIARLCRAGSFAVDPGTLVELVIELEILFLHSLLSFDHALLHSLLRLARSFN